MEWNPTGTRCGDPDLAVGVWGTTAGIAPGSTRALQTTDNVGVQYGLDAFEAGQISAQQFLDLNQSIGGYDGDGNIVAQRSVANPQALGIAYQTGKVNEGGGGLASIPIIDLRPYLDQVANVHDAVRTDTMRARLIAANGTAANQVTLETPFNGVLGTVGATVLPEMNQWLDNISNDHAPAALIR